MKYTVVWAAEAEEELAALWASAVDREAISKVANSLDHNLGQNPVQVGESRRGARRIAYYLPLGIKFEILEDDRLVQSAHRLAM